MTATFNVYCDESCHLENDRQKAMVLGAVWCPLEKSREIAVRLREIRHKHGLGAQFEDSTEERGASGLRSRTSSGN